MRRLKCGLDVDVIHRQDMKTREHPHAALFSACNVRSYKIKIKSKHGLSKLEKQPNKRLTL